MSAQFPPQPPAGPPPGPHPTPVAPSAQSTGKMLAIVAAVVAAAMALAGGIYAISRPDTSDTVNTADSVTTDAPIVTESPVTDASIAPDVTEPPVTEPPATDSPTTEPPVTEPPSTEPPTTEAPDPDGDLTTVGDLLAWTSFAADPLDDVARQAEIDRLISERQVDAVAHPSRVSVICAGIPVDVAIDLDIIWQFAGDTVQTDSFAAVPPGVGTCIDNGGEPLSAGSYQVLAATSDLSDVGFATTFVVGAEEVRQSFINNTDVAICEVGVAPVDTGYYELFVVDGGELAPGELLEITIASVEQDLLARTCDGSDIGDLSFFPDGFGAQNLGP